MRASGFFKKFFGYILILLGIVLYPTPIPGTTLLIAVGLVWVIGKKRARNLIHKIIGKERFLALKLHKILRKID